jgi:cytochrome c oxidase subunit 3
MKAERHRHFLDVSQLPTVMFGKHNVSWLGNVFYMTIEAAMFVMMVVSYFFLKTRSNHWPPSGFLPPNLRFGMAGLGVFFISIFPAWWTKKKAFCQEKAAVTWGLAALSLCAVTAITIRWFEFSFLNCRWTDNAYASCLWVLLGIHTGHLITEFIETIVLMAISTTDQLEGIRFADIGMNSDYWYFVVGLAVLADVIIYGTTRWL